ncbi:MAG: ACP S-malonyltransferase [Candidatus Calescibacterium sp.]|nr:ACP S-malonyltransferase [Candidatus Calescibacterium sp.]MCX7733709.1 ACP S-malonyltransferase [bacterium]
MKKLAVIFPGQGSQYVGMGKESLHSERFVSFLKRADDVLGFELSKIMFEGPENILTLTENAQPAIFVMSYAIFQIISDSLQKDSELILGGHSLGEYTAVSCAGAISFEDCVKLVRLRGKFMQEAVPEGEGSMSAVILPKEKVEEEVKKFENLWIANVNSQDQVVVSGKKESVEKFSEYIRKNFRARVVPLKVSAPFHSPLMAPAREKLKEAFNKVNIGQMKFKILSAHTVQYYSKETVEKTLLDGIVSEVNFLGFIKKLYEDGVRDFVEVGPGKVLSSLVKRILHEFDDVRISTVNAVD